MNPWGNLYIASGALFSVDNNHHPIILKGYITAQIGSPATIYAIKFDRFDMDLFQTKVDQFRFGSLPQNEYFIVQNTHTKYSLKNEPNKITVSVESGEVQVSSEKLKRSVVAGKQISIDAKNNIKESVYLGSRIYLIIGTVLVVVSSILLFIYRKTKTGQKILVILKMIAIWFWKTIKQIVKLIWTMIKKVAPIIWNILKTSLQKLILFIKKLGKKNKS